MRALRAAGEGFDRCRDCLLSTAVRRTFGDPRVSCGLSTLTAGHVIYRIPPAAADVISLFDNQAYDELRALLPVTFPLEVLE
ncbi:MAG: hypothetical protein Q8T13_05095 [Acidobacteriota bacterium]|nr:hypothetical protein [Acidobacteriota bacterium]